MCHSISGAPSALAISMRQHGLAGAGLAFDQERPLQRDRGVDRDFQIVGGDVGVGAFKTHADPAEF